jgi:hypothetical protein
LPPRPPAEKLIGARPAPALRVEGARLVAGPNGSAPVVLRGITWPGFDAGATFVAGLGGQSNRTWSGGDFATALHVLRLLGFNAVRLPFTFDGLQSAPLDVARPCPSAPPGPAQLAKRAVDPERAPAGGALPPPPPPFLPPGAGANGSAGGACNAYVPRGPTTLTRLLWTVEAVAAAGMYAALDYRPAPPPPGPAGAAAPRASAALPAELDSPAAFAAAWGRLGAALACLPSWKGGLAGRVLAGLLSGPDALGLGWQGPAAGGAGGAAPGHAPLGDYYLAALDALEAAAPGGGLLYMLQGPSASGFADGKPGAQGASAFLAALLDRPYRGRVAVAPSLAAGASAATQEHGVSFADGWCAPCLLSVRALSSQGAVGVAGGHGCSGQGARARALRCLPDLRRTPRPAALRGFLAAKGFCSGGAQPKAAPGPKVRCQTFPVIASEVSGRLAVPQEAAFLADAARSLAANPGAAMAEGVPAAGWFW